MNRSILVLILIQVFAGYLYSQDKPTLVYLGVNGYPSSDTNTYKIEIYVSANGYISGIKSYVGNTNILEEQTSITFKQQSLIGETESKDSRTSFTFILNNNEIVRSITIWDINPSEVFSKKNSTVRIAPIKDIIFETDDRRFIKSNKIEFQIKDSKTGDNLYLFEKNNITNDGWYRSAWKNTGNSTSVNEFITMERFSDWIDAGHGVFTGKAFNNPNQLINIVNCCILDVVYPNNPIFIPFIFGLKTGSY